MPPIRLCQTLFEAILEGGRARFFVLTYHGFKACQELDIEPRTEVRRFADPLLEKKFVIEANLKRRHLTDFQKAELGHLLEPIERELAKRRQVELAGTRPNTKPDTLAPNDAEVIGDTGKTAKFVAQKVGLSTRTYERAKQIIEKAPEELKTKVRKGETSINYAYKQVKRAKSLHSKIAEKKCKTGLNYDAENSLRR